MEPPISQKRIRAPSVNFLELRGIWQRSGSHPQTIAARAHYEIVRINENATGGNDQGAPDIDRRCFPYPRPQTRLDTSPGAGDMM